MDQYHSYMEYVIDDPYSYSGVHARVRVLPRVELFRGYRAANANFLRVVSSYTKLDKGVQIQAVAARLKNASWSWQCRHERTDTR